ncbi:MAG: hypothetical protein AMS27_04420 [Bacteroides sp. SM23_62_1]|nr:MAG: hypothetical protein AMS27_04420 [Bacteroides sp. SM23_62_1]
MFQNCLLSAIRNLIRYRMVALLNVLGLSIGIGVCVMIFIYVRYETSFDNYHPEVDRTYRIEKISNIYNEIEKVASIPRFLGDEIMNYEEVEVLGRIGPWRSNVVWYGDIAHKMSGIFTVDPGIFQIFDIEILAGDPVQSMNQPFKVVLTETTAGMFFADKSGIGEIIEIDTNHFEVVGIVRDFPHNTHARMNVMFSAISQKSMTDMPEEVRRFNHLMTYVILKEWVNPVDFENRIYNLVNELEPDYLERSGEDMKLFLRHVRDIHLHANQLKWDVEPGGNPVFLYMVSVIGFLILLITCFNFMNLSTARYTSRSFEVGIRKATGATRKQLIWQFLGESVSLAIIAHIVGMFLVELFLPFLNRIGNLSLDIHYSDPVFILYILIIILVIGVFAGSYPAFFLSSFKPVLVIKGMLGRQNRGNLVRRILVLAQYIISISLIIATAVVYKQLIYMKNYNMGFIKENKLIIEFPENQVTLKNCRFIKDAFMSHPGVYAATISSSVPGRWRYWWMMWPTGEAADKTRMMNCLQVDYDFISIYGLELLAGKAFDPALSDSSNRGMILNEAAIHVFNWESPEAALTKTLNRNSNPVRGVFKNYHFKGLQNPVEPLGMYLIEDDFRYITLVFESRAIDELIKYTGRKFTELFPDGVFDYFFLDEDFEKQYEQEKRQGMLVLVFTILGIIIASLGLIGMISFLLENRRKEIGIRKINGAMVIDIFWLLIRNSSSQILLAFLIACPLAWFGGRAWLQDFAYSTNLSWWIFAGAGLVAWILAFLTISMQSLKAARQNPAEALRYE